MAWSNKTQEALKMAIEALEGAEIVLGIMGGQEKKVDVYAEAINACKEALEQPLTRDWKETVNERKAKDIEFAKALEQQEIGDAEIRQMLNDIEYYKERLAKYEDVL